MADQVYQEFMCSEGPTSVDLSHKDSNIHTDMHIQ